MSVVKTAIKDWYVCKHIPPHAYEFFGLHGVVAALEDTQYKKAPIPTAQKCATEVIASAVNT